MMTQSWRNIVVHYDAYKGEHSSIRELQHLARRICASPLERGLFAWTSMFDLCIVQIEVKYPFDGPYLRLSPVSEREIEFRYIDTYEKTRQWQRTVAAEDVWSRLIRFLEQLMSFPSDVLERAKDCSAQSATPQPPPIR